MKIAIWVTFALLAGFWTLMSAITAEIAQWLAQWVAAGGAAELGRSSAQWPTPAWLSPWIDPAQIGALQAMLLQGFEAFRTALPSIGAALGWLVPLVWIVWGFGFATLLALAVIGHLLLGRAARR